MAECKMTGTPTDINVNCTNNKLENTEEDADE